MKDWIKGTDYPFYMSEEALITLHSGGYLSENESPRDAIQRVANQVELELNMKGISERVFSHVWAGNIGLSSPLWSNFGKERGLPISCFGSYVGDSVTGFTEAVSEVAKMSQMGGGTSGYLGDVRHNGADISNSIVKADGVMTPLAMIDNTVRHISQGTRRGYFAGYLPFAHKDIFDFLTIKSGGSNIQSIMTGVTLRDEDIADIEAGDKNALEKWAKVLESRNNIGIPFILFEDNANLHSSTPKPYKKKRTVRASNLCSEIMLPQDEEESFVCCLASMNLLNVDSWLKTDAVEVCVYLLEAVLNEFIRKASDIKEMSKAVKFAKRHRALGIGTLGEHSLLQRRMIPFGSIAHEGFIHQTYSEIERQAKEASVKLADKYGACEVNKLAGVNMRHTTLTAIAPTTTNALIAGGSDCSGGIEPKVANVTQRNLQSIQFLAKNSKLKEVLIRYGEDKEEVWSSITDTFGSVQHLEFMLEEDKEVFKTGYEINQYQIIKMASLRQRYLCQSQSLNLFISPTASPQDRSELLLTAFHYGLKSLYYQKGLAVAKEGKTQEEVLKYMEEVNEGAFDNTCLSCEG